MTLINRLRAVLLVLVLLPLLTVATPPRAASAQATPRYVQLVSLKCYLTEDWTGTDEPYLTVGGSIVWSGSLSDNQSVNLIGLSARRFYSQVNIELYDDDSPEIDDWLGTRTVFSTEAGQGTHTAVFDKNGAIYYLTYYVF